MDECAENVTSHRSENPRARGGARIDFAVRLGPSLTVREGRVAAENFTSRVKRQKPPTLKREEKQKTKTTHGEPSRQSIQGTETLIIVYTSQS